MNREIKCQNCKVPTKVVGSYVEEGDYLRRQRQCMVCGFQFWTTQKITKEEAEAHDR